MRIWSKIDTYYQEILSDIYPQPIDEGHRHLIHKIIYEWLIPLGHKDVLDVGCGEGNAEEFFKHYGFDYTGIAFGQDVNVATANNRNVSEMDFNFLDYSDNSFDLIFSRHSLEHSLMPLLTLMEWHRVSKEWLCIVLPNPQHYTFVGRNHYSVSDATQSAWFLRRSGWKINKALIRYDEMWFLCKKSPRIGYEGWASAPVIPEIYEFERDLINVRGEVPIPEAFRK